MWKLSMTVVGALCFFLLFETAAYGQEMVTLTVNSSYGMPVPAVGVHTYEAGTVIAAGVASPVGGGGGVRYACVGWKSKGDPEHLDPVGFSNSVTFTITKSIVMTWKWKAQYLLTLNVAPVGAHCLPGHIDFYCEDHPEEPSGTVPPDPCSWWSYKSVAQLEAVEHEGYDFAYWSGGSLAVRMDPLANPTAQQMRRPETITAVFTPEPRYFTVASEQGEPVPAVGTHTYHYDDTVDANCGLNPYPAGEGMQYVCTGHTGTGDVTDGPEASISFVIHHDSSVTWLWEVASIYSIYVDGTHGDDSNNGFCWATAVKTIQRGLDLAGNWTVLVADGTYTGTGNKNLNFNGKAVHLKSVGGAENCVIDCENFRRGFYFGSGEDENSVVEGFTIRNGVMARYGGAVYCYSSSPTITDCTFSGNSAEGDYYYDGGGAVRCDSNSSPAITNCTFSGNSAVSKGGAVHCSHSSPTITDCTFSGNSANVSGGAVYCYYSSPTITNCTFSGNSAEYFGGGVYCSVSSPTITDCTFSGNSADSCGGAVICRDNSSVTITNCTFRENSANVYGGAVYCYYSSPTITNCAFSKNSAHWYGGAVICRDYSSPTVTNCTLIGNWARVYGGAVYCHDFASPTINNSILWSNSASYDGNEIHIYDSSASATLNNSDVTPGGYGGYAGNITENSCIHSDPLFIDGGDYHLQATSPCIDAGDNSLVPEGVTTDLDGNPRIVDGNTPPDGTATVDMGAYEYQP